ncbi:PH domain-containing protein [Salibacterium aidingense]|uniref:PH domain-containing protein n=1 Tax=Salibacterium aidingense TaxID=384933 RepID=UPI003BD0EFF9
MKEAKRYHPLLLVFQLKTLLRSSFIIAIYLFLIKAGSDAVFYTYARHAFFLGIGLSVFSMIYKWFTRKYKLEQGSFQLYKGLFSISRQTIPFSKVQNVHRHTSWLHHLFHLTSITFETNMEDKEDSVIFRAVSPVEADRMEEMVKQQESRHDEAFFLSEEEPGASDPAVETSPSKTVHFKPGVKDHVKASITSLSFLALLPVLFSLSSNLDSINALPRLLENSAAPPLFDAWWKISLLVLVVAGAAFLFGAVRTVLQYGRYEIVSDSQRIYITKGFFNATSFSILKNKVQAIECRQPPVKRWLGITEVRLISAGGLNEENETKEITTLYPFLSEGHARELIEEMLPAYTMAEHMDPLPRKSLAVRLARPSWVWFTATLLLFYFEPSLFGFEIAWWGLSAVLLGLVLVSRLLDFFHTHYTLQDECIQWKKGSWTTFLFLTKREKIAEIACKRGFLQKKAGLASLETINRATPVKHTELDDIPAEWSRQMQQWYHQRTKEITTQ